MDALLDLPAAERERALARIAAQSPGRAAELKRWLGAIDASAGLLENAAGPSGALDRLGPWRIGGLLGRGGSGEVYLGQRSDGAFERKVAIKLLRSDRDADWRITEERRLLARLVHPHIAGLLDGGIAADGRPYLVIEYIEGLTLDRWLSERKPGLSVRMRVFAALGEAVAYAHANGVVHADLKPANVLITADDQPKLLDFGIARLLDHGATNASGGRMLSPEFAAPEQFLAQEATPQTDVYALGLLLYLLLTGRLPQDTAGLSVAQLRSLRLNQPVPPPSARATPALLPAKRLTGDLDAIVLRALAREPTQRYLTVASLLADLRAWASHHPVRARGGGRAYVAARWLRRHWLAVALAMVATSALVAGAGAALWQSRQVRAAHLHAEAIRDFLSELIAASDLRTVRQPANAVPALLRAAVGRIEAQPLGPEVDTEILVLLATALLSHEQYAAAEQALALADARASAVRSGKSLEVERATLHAELALIPLDFVTARKAIDSARAALGDRPEPEALSLIDARVRVREGDVDRALGILETLIAARERDAGARHVRTLAARLWKLEALRMDHRREAAISFGGALLKDIEATLPPDHALLPAVLNHLGFAHFDLYEGQRHPQGLDQAQAAFERALGIARKLYGEGSLASINARDGLAMLLHNRGDAAGHIAQLTQIEAAESALFGRASLRPWLTRFHMGFSRYLSGEREQGERDILAAEAAVERTGSPKELAVIRQQWALLLLREGQSERGLAAAERALVALGALKSGSEAMRASLHRARARALANAGDHAAALKAAGLAVASALSLAKDQPDELRFSLQHRMRAELALGDLESARRTLAELKALPVGSEEGEKVTAKLAEQLL